MLSTTTTFSSRLPYETHVNYSRQLKHFRIMQALNATPSRWDSTLNCVPYSINESPCTSISLLGPYICCSVTCWKSCHFLASLRISYFFERLLRFRKYCISIAWTCDSVWISFDLISFRRFSIFSWLTYIPKLEATRSLANDVWVCTLVFPWARKELSIRESLF